MEVINCLDCIPIMRKDLIQFTDDLEKTNPGIKFDYSEMNKLEKTNLWFVEIMQNNQFKDWLFQQLLKPGQKDTDDMTNILDVLTDISC